MKKIMIVLMVSVLAIIGSGCSIMGKESYADRIVSGLEEKYGEKFEFQSWSWEIYGSKSKTAHVTCESLPGKMISASQTETEDGDFEYSDDYMAYKYESELKSDLEERVKAVFPQSRIILMLDSSEFPKTMGPDMSKDEVVSDKDTCFSVYILVNQNIDENQKDSQLEILRQSFESGKMRVNGDMFFTEDETAWVSVSDDNYSQWVEKEDWYEERCGFAMDKNYEFLYADWK